MKPCSVSDCPKPVKAHDLCATHLSRQYRTGDPQSQRAVRILGDDVKRFWSKIDKNGPLPTNRPELGRCWQWTGTKSDNSRKRSTPLLRYGLFGTWDGNNNVFHRAHRYAYEMLVGSIGEGLQIDHLCKNTLCVNPSHLEPVTPQENHHRSNISEVLSAKYANDPHCKRGHPLSGANLYIRPDTGQRVCRECQRARQREYERRRSQ